MTRSGIAPSSWLAGARDCVRRSCGRSSASRVRASLFDLRRRANAPAVSDEPTLPDVPRWAEAERLTREKEILGFFISGHPLEKYRDDVRMFEEINTATLKSFREIRRSSWPV